MSETTPEPQSCDLKSYRQYILDNSNLPEDLSADVDNLLSDTVDFVKFYKQVSPFEKTTYPNPLRLNIPSKFFPSVSDNIMHAQRLNLDRIAGLADGEHTYANTLGAMEAFDRAIQPLYSSIDFVGHVSPLQDVRDASNIEQARLSGFFIEQSARNDVFLSVKKFNNTPEAQKLVGEELKSLQDTMRAFRRDGLELDFENKQTFVQLKTKLSTLAIKFSQNLVEEKTTFTLSKEDLVGLSDDQLANFKSTEEDVDGVKVTKYIVGLKTPEFLPVMKYCQNPETRKKFELAYNSRCAEQNGAILNEALKIRTKLAQLLGYKTHAEFVLDESMAKTPAHVSEFLTDLDTRLTPLYERDQAALLATKKRVYKDLGLNDEIDTVTPYDRAFLTNIIEREDYAVDQEEVKKYFPVDHVTSTLLDLYSKLFGFKFTEVNSPDMVYHPDVRLFNVYDTTGVAKPDELFGMFYADLFPRDGKYGHAAVFPLVAAYQDNGHARSPSVSGIVCNFPAPKDGKPGLMTSNDVITYLHEFGHAIHGLASKTQLTRYAGTSTLRDFVELPSQCVENIFLTKKYLKLFTKHFQTGLPAPDELLDKIILADKCQQGSFNKRQLTFALTDQAMHNITDPDADTDANQVYSETLNRIMNFSPSKNTNFPATFGHLMGGYDSFYYGYLFSLSLAASVWDKIDKDNEKNGNEEAFKIYRTKVLQRGGSIDPNLIVEDFLGEKPTSGPFLKSLGL